MDNKTKHQLKQPDKFVLTTENSIVWAKENRSSAITWVAVLVVVILAGVGGYALYEHRTIAAQTAFGNAMQTYQTPLATPGQQIPPGTKTFPDAKARAKQANAEFLAVANQYGMTEPGKLATYFAGLTYIEEGQNGSAEDTLKKVASGWNGDTAALAKEALAQLDQQTGRDQDAAPLYDQLAKKDATTVPSGLAKIELAEMYTAEGKTVEANKIYAELKDKDKDAKGEPGPAAQIATQKLGAKK